MQILWTPTLEILIVQVWGHGLGICIFNQLAGGGWGGWVLM